MINRVVRERVVSIFSEPALGAINFGLGSVQVNWTNLRSVGRAIDRQEIDLIEEENLPADAQYEDQVIYLTRDSLGTLDSLVTRALILHEAVHAMIATRHRVPPTGLTGEVAGFLVQCIYRLASGDQRLRIVARNNQNSPDGRIFNETIALIDRFNMLKIGNRAQLNGPDYSGLRNTIRNHPIYNRRDHMEAHETVDSF